MPIETADLLIFLTASLALNLTPGNDMMFVLGQSLKDGVRSGVAASFGIATGSLIHLVLVMCGATVLLTQHPIVFDGIRYAGAAYLLWMAFKTLRSGPVILDPQTAKRTAFQAWRYGTLVNVFNPKTIIFMFAFLPPFVRPELGSALLQLFIFGMIFNIGGTLINVLVAIFAHVAARCFSSNVKILKGFTLVSSAVFLVLAVRMVFDKR